MNLVGWNPSRELEALTDPLNRVFARPVTRRSNGKEIMPVADWAVSVDISDTDGGFHIRAEFSGLKNEAGRVTMDKGRFTLQGEPNEK
jgi:HSP20 family molecular chaperone IbpA